MLNKGASFSASPNPGGSPISLVCRQSDLSFSQSPPSSMASTPNPSNASFSSSSISFRPLTETRKKLAGLTCKQARELIPMGKTNDRPPAPTSENVRHVLAGPNASKILLISPQETPMTAFKKLIDYGVQSAPVIDPVTNKCCGLLDIRDLVSLVVAMEEELQQQQTNPLSLGPSRTINTHLDHPHPTSSMAPPIPLSPARPPIPASPSRISRRASPAPDEMAHTPLSPFAHPPLPPSAFAHPLPPTPNHTPSATHPPLHPSSAHSHTHLPSSHSPTLAPMAAPPQLPLTSYLGQIFSRRVTVASLNTRQLDHKPQDYTVTYLAARNRCVTVDWEAPILTVVEVLATMQDVHRVVVVSGEGVDRRIVDIISQSDIVKLVHALFSKYVAHTIEMHAHTHVHGHMHADHAHTHDPSVAALLAELELSVDESNIGSSPVISVPASQSMFATLRLMSTHKISGAAVVDSSGSFVGATSGADLKLYLQAPSSQRLHIPVMDFVGEVRRIASLSGARTVFPAVGVEPSTSLLMVIAKLTATGMHRVFVVEPVENRPLAVVSVEDIVKMLHRGCPNRKMDRQLHRALSVGCMVDAKSPTPTLVTSSSTSSVSSLASKD